MFTYGIVWLLSSLVPLSILYNGSLILYRIASILKTNVMAMQAMTAATSLPGR